MRLARATSPALFLKRFVIGRIQFFAVVAPPPLWAGMGGATLTYFRALVGIAARFCRSEQKPALVQAAPS